MDTRRDFIKKAMMLGGAAGMATLPASIQKAFAINPETGSTFFDAEHIVLLMQENRSFDHAFGTLRGVRGFNDPRAMQQPNKNLVWMQTNAQGETYTPFRLDIKDTKITWMGSLPHSRQSQVDARNNGGYDNWIEAKKSDGEYAHMPLTMGYYTREDIPFYYALADAFTVCDQNFCSALSPTDPNRLHFWSGTVRAEHDEDSRAFLDNDDIERGVEWRTFPELLEQNNISWKVYQNEVTIGAGFTEEEDAWLGNFGDNPLQFFNQYNAKLLQRYVEFLPKEIEGLQKDISTTQAKLHGLTQADKEYGHAQKELQYRQEYLNGIIKDKEKYSAAVFNNLSPFDKSIHQKAFAVNTNDSFQHELTPLNYMDDNINREINIPKGDVLHQFRKDVEEGNLPTVSWLVAPQNFSDHPSAPWFGAWYLSEAMDILTNNPEVWKKTIFILAYDENDGYYDHVPPFVAPEYGKPETGLVSDGIDTRLDHVKTEADVTGPIGLGYRVPLVIASPWSRGGLVNSQLFDHTSVLQFLEVFVNKKFNKNIQETNITPWRRMVCGDLTSTFQKYEGEKIEPLPFHHIKPFVESIHKAKFKNVPSNYKSLTADEIKAINKNTKASSYMPQQEKGQRSACALPYELYADGSFNNATKSFAINLQADNKFFQNAKGSPFIVHARNYAAKDFTEKSYAVIAGDALKDNFQLNDFANNNYYLEVYAPNGFYRKFQGNGSNNLVDVMLKYETSPNNKLTGNAVLLLKNNRNAATTVQIKDNSYNAPLITKQLMPNDQQTIVLDLSKSFGWYDVNISIKNNDTFLAQYAGHVETGYASMSDPAMANA